MLVVVFVVVVVVDELVVIIPVNCSSVLSYVFETMYTISMALEMFY